MISYIGFVVANTWGFSMNHWWSHLEYIGLLYTWSSNVESVGDTRRRVRHPDCQRRLERELDLVSTGIDPDRHERVLGPKDARGLRVDARHPPAPPSSDTN